MGEECGSTLPKTIDLVRPASAHLTLHWLHTFFIQVLPEDLVKRFEEVIRESQRSTDSILAALDKAHAEAEGMSDSEAGDLSADASHTPSQQDSDDGGASDVSEAGSEVDGGVEAELEEVRARNGNFCKKEFAH